MKFPADAATYKAWCDKLMEGLLIAFCVITALFLVGPIGEAVVAVIGDTPIYSTLKCGFVEGALSSPYFPDALKGRERGIRYRTGCHKNSTATLAPIMTSASKLATISRELSPAT